MITNGDYNEKIYNRVIHCDKLKIKRSNGIGGGYQLTLRVHPYYGAHNSYGIDEVVVRASGELVSYKHIKTYL
ncbi:DUF3888 domain-containing protein [Peribacillus cavernae]|uniref:DUF3888 domain-containing protein n=1 Tax=Peribacillus cavernae TaxID=1674310 RepID=A0A3S0VY95_9BACI|nr:DUF3888 domain-containing protein [Peribacillus cavernae]MDQ0220164.1 hypothetical protein [Peribacillus cavernae]RUQ28794.1 DUF3888 domain-containing protein [Peribacillus cavernae]